MKLINKSLLSLLLITCLWLPTHAQSGQGQIKGLVYNPDQLPAEYSTVVLMNKDSVFMKGALSGEDGSYLFEDLDPENYLIMIRNVEFNTYVSEPIQLEANEVHELKPIKLVTRVTGLEEVVIKGEKALVEVRADKMVYNVASSVNASGNNGLELLSKSPGVIVDLDNKISLQGKSGVRIFINGRPSRVSGSDLTNMLQGMRSDNIESIEIISNPSAKYEAEGTGGIINIILKKNTDLGFNGNVIANFSQGVHPRTNVGTSLNYSGEKTSFFSTIALSRDEYKTDRAESIQREDYFTDMDSKSTSERNGLNISAGLDHRFNSEHTLSLDVRVLLNDRSSYLESSTTISDLTGNLPPQLLLAETDGQGSSENYNANLHYSFVPNKSSSLTADLSFGLYSNGADTYQPNAYYDIGAEDPNRTVESSYNTNTGINLFSARLEYEKSIGKISISAGGKYAHISTDNQLAYYNIEGDSSTLDPNRSNDFSYLEQVVAAYLIFNAKLTDRIGINAGLRVENTSSLGELTSATPSPDDVVARNYTSYFPNVSFSYSDQENHAFSLSIGRRISRPNYQDLNPFERKLSEI
ncbi:MAG: TonB-dependent receptor, partial [Bacteroides sp.]|nr:TonB-dependent receptor [Bacteroides sp.]